MRFYSELTYWNTACCKKCKNAFVSLSLRWKELQNKENPCKLILYGDFLFLVHSKNKHIKAFFRGQRIFRVGKLSFKRIA